MFYSQFILAKKGPLGTIWIAAHLERKLRKNQVADTDIGISVDSILSPDVPIALRLSSHLLLGVVRIYSRKVNYLFDDCSEALLKVKQAFRSTAVDLPPEESTAPYHSITLPETFDLDDFELPDSDILQGNYVDHHVSTREQITLQDTMEGVVYSTSQFGLDERFGDGDTSGLNLDEAIFLNKVTAPGHAGVMTASDADPCASVQPMSPLEQDKNHERITGNSKVMVATGRANQLDDLSGNTDYVEYAEAPCTPGLVEEPNLSITQEASACDDQLELVEEPNLVNVKEASACDESENHNIANFAAKENMASITSNSAFDSINGFQDLENGVSSHDEPGTCCIDGAHAGSVSENVSEMHEVPVGPGFLNNDANAGNIEKSCPTSNSVASNIEFPGRQDLKILEKTQACQDPKFCESLSSIVHEELTASDIHVLQPCKHLNQLSSSNSGCDVSVGPQLQSGVIGHCSKEPSEEQEAPSVSEALTDIQGEGCYATDFMNHVLEQNQTTEPDSCVEIQAGINKLNDQVDNVILEDNRMENIVGSENLELPPPEKLLSIPEGLADLQDILLESTPDKAHLVSADGGDAGINITSGKKRSFDESTLTLHSLNSVDSLAGAQSKRTKESVPDDNDLLASILVGRRSSVLKIMPTPTPPPEITCMKRQRSAPRFCGPKRKILMDDAMILHGDVIRQQLTSTEDIRRMRKKAPCTRSEIWMIQKEYLEDEIFTEPIFTGFSGGLVLLHSQTYDLSEIRVSENDAHNPSEAVNNMEFSMEPDVYKETGMEGFYESLVGRNHVEEARPENQQYEDHVLQGHDTQVQIEAICEFPEPQSRPYEQSMETAEIRINGAGFSVPDAVDPGIDLGLESALSPNFALGDENTISADSAVRSALFNKESAGDHSVQIDASVVSPDQKLDAQPVEMETSIAYISSGLGVDAIEKAEENGDSAGVGGTESRVGDLGETEFGFESSMDMQTARYAHSWEANPSLEISPETDKPSNPVVVTVDNTMDEFSKNEQGYLKEDEVLAPESGYDDARNMSSYNGEYPGPPGCWEADPQSIMDAETSVAGHTATVDCNDTEYSMDWHDTGFLNADDDDAVEDEECMPSAEQTSFLDNSGWSSRTRAVAKYLKVLFDKEAEQGRKVLPMDNLLVGKTRKEASRMFFEALVLKTRDYIHVEQQAPFDDIKIKPRVMLMKSDL